MNCVYDEKLISLKKMGRLRTLVPFAEDTFRLNLASNDYLGIGNDQDLQEEFLGRYNSTTRKQYKFASSSSRLLTGDTPLAHALEQELASAYQSDAALLYNSGYHANIGILPALCGKKDLILSDKLNHASIHDGLRLSRARSKRYRHCDYEQLRTILAGCRKEYKRVVIVSESVFSMDGDEADIGQLMAIKKEFDALLYMDEAHGVGLYGESGLGKVEAAGALKDVDLVVGTFGKAWASVGAFVCCSKSIKQYLVNHSRSLIFSTVLAPITINWNRFVFHKSLGMEKERDYLQTISAKFRTALASLGIVQDNSSNIIPITIGSDTQTVERAERMQDLGYLILPIRPPAVPEGSARFRLSLCADMQLDDLQALATHLLAKKKGQF